MKKAVIICILFSLSLCHGQAQPLESTTKKTPTVENNAIITTVKPAESLKPAESPKLDSNNSTNPPPPEHKEAEVATTVKPGEKAGGKQTAPATEDNNTKNVTVNSTTEKAASISTTQKTPSTTPAEAKPSVPPATVPPTPHPKDNDTDKPTVQAARGFDGPSFIGGIILTLGLLAIGFMGFKYYKNQTERNYHTL